MEKKKVGRVIIVVVTVVMLYFLLSGKYGLINLYTKIHRPYKQQQEQIRLLHATNDSLRQEIKRLQSDTAYIERIAREKLGMAGKGETVYRFVDKDKK
jgi:cell division protein FtsB